MYAQNYVGSLEDSNLFEGDYYLFWVQIILELADTIWPEPEEDFDRLKNILLTYFLLTYYRTKRNEDNQDENIIYTRREVVRLRGADYYRDNSELGLKYRCLMQMASTIEQNERDYVNWWVGLDTSLMCLSMNGQNDEMMIAKIKEELTNFEAELRIKRLAEYEANYQSIL